jgi:homoserine kinase
MSERSNTAKQSQLPNSDARTFEVRVSASTSNLGAGFDCLGLALQLYLTIRATVSPRSKVKCRVRTTGAPENEVLPQTAENLIYRALAYAADREGFELPPLDLAVHNEIPLGRGLGSSAAAIVGGIKLFALLGGELTDDKVLQYAAEFEGHADNVAASLLGGFTVSCIGPAGNVIAVKRAWPADIKIVVVSPDTHVETRLARATLPRHVNHVDAVYNLQRVALFNAALFEHRYEILWEAMQDRLHQQKRQTLVPGLAEALAIQQLPGLLGLALSGAGPSVVALAQERFDQIGATIARCFKERGIDATVRQLEVDNDGCQSRVV